MCCGQEIEDYELTVETADAKTSDQSTDTADYEKEDD
jgi:hypothetical protein